MAKDSAFECTALFDANYRAKESVIINQGGTYSSKTWSILQAIFIIATTQRNVTITVAGESVPNLKRGAYKQAQEIISGSKYLRSWLDFHNKTDRILLFKTGSMIEFNSYENEQQARGGKRDYLFVNEANWMEWEIFQQLAVRTEKRVFIDYNPSAPFWAHDKLIGTKGINNELQMSVKFIRSWHQHNPFITEQKHRQIEGNTDKEWHRVYARGYTGNLEGLIYPAWQTITVNQFNSIAEQNDRFFGGLDIGYTNDPSAGYKMFKAQDSLYIHELFYETGLSNKLIKEHLSANGWEKNKQVLWTEHDENVVIGLRRLGIRAMPARKGPGSIKAGISMVKQWKVYVTDTSKFILDERRRYMWEKDKITGKLTNQPIDAWNHGMDAIRYGAYSQYFKQAS